MSSNILLNNSEVRYETHVWSELDLPIRFRKTQLDDQDYALNIHENLELLFFVEGEGHVLYDGVRCPVRSGDIVAVNSYCAHQVGTDGSLTQICLTLGQDFCQSNNINPRQLLFQRLVRGDRQAIALFQKVVDAHEAPGKFQKAMIRCASLELLLHMCVHYSAPREEGAQARDRAVEYVYRAIQFMKANLARKLTADEIAASAGLSKYHFLREFKRITGYTPAVYLNAIRCKHARNLLESGRHSVKEVAVLCGFTDSAYFCRVFRQHTGFRPTQLQPKCQDRPAPELGVSGGLCGSLGRRY